MFCHALVRNQFVTVSKSSDNAGEMMPWVDQKGNSIRKLKESFAPRPEKRNTLLRGHNDCEPNRKKWNLQ